MKLNDINQFGHLCIPHLNQLQIYILIICSTANVSIWNTWHKLHKHPKPVVLYIITICKDVYKQIKQNYILVCGLEYYSSLVSRQPIWHFSIQVTLSTVKFRLTVLNSALSHSLNYLAFRFILSKLLFIYSHCIIL